MRRDDGSAIVEFVFLAVVLMIPVVYLVLTFARLQAGAFAADAVARDAARAAAVQGYEAVGDGASVALAVDRAHVAAEAIAEVTATDFGFDSRDVVLSLTCRGGACFAPGTDVVASVDITVALPGVPSFLQSAAATMSSVRASPIDRLAP